MKYFFVLLLAVLVFQNVHASKYSITKGQELFEKCRAAERIIDNEKNITASDISFGSICTSYITGFGDGSYMTSFLNSLKIEKNANFKKYKKYRLYCGKNITLRDMVHAIVAHIRNNPKLRKESARIAITSTLKKYYPCK